MNACRGGLVAASIVVLLLGGGAQGQSQNLIRNGDFEKFAGDDPAGWETTNIPKFCTVVTPSPIVHSGKQAVKLEVKDCAGTKFPGMITQKNIPIKGKSFRMQFWYQLRSVGNDVGYISMDFKNAEGSTVRMCEERLTGSKTEFTQFSAIFPAPEGATHADLKVALLATSRDGTLHEGSFVLIDDISLVVAEVEKAAP